MEDLVDRLRIAFAERGGVRLAVLFGSRANGTSRPSSDVDVAFWPTDADMPLAAELALASSLSSITGTEVDLVRLDDATPLLGREVATTGICLFEREAGLFSAWRARAVSAWIDFDEIIAPHRATFLARVAAKGSP